MKNMFKCSLYLYLHSDDEQSAARGRFNRSSGKHLAACRHVRQVPAAVS